MLSTRNEVHNRLHHHQRRTKPWPQLTCTEYFLSFGHVVFDMYEQTDKQADRKTYTLIEILCTPIRGGSKQYGDRSS